MINKFKNLQTVSENWMWNRRIRNKIARNPEIITKLELRSQDEVQDESIIFDEATAPVNNNDPEPATPAFSHRIYPILESV